jgi:hypothetical protein
VCGVHRNVLYLNGSELIVILNIYASSEGFVFTIIVM